MTNRSRWALAAGSTAVFAAAWFAAGALGESAPPDLGSRIVVDTSVGPVSEQETRGGVRVAPNFDATTAPAVSVVPPVASVAPAPPAPPAPPPAGDPGDSDDDGPGDDDDDDDDGDGDGDDEDDDAGDG